jgi:hypothetical protein
MDKLITKLESISADDRKIITNKVLWLSEESLAHKYYYYLYPHSSLYQSPLIPIFLFELNDIDFLNYFPAILARDGSLSLIKFFYTYPEPKNIKTTILINRKLSSLVPEAWQDNIAFYTFSSEATNVVEQSVENIYLSLFSDVHHCSYEFAKERLTTLKESMTPGHKPKINCFFNYNIPVGEELLKKHKTGHMFKITSFLTKLFIDFEIEYLNYEEITSSNMEDSVFLDLNECDFLISDCFVKHLCVSQGAKIFKNDNKNDEIDKNTYFVPYSFFHKLIITNEFSQTEKANSKIMYDELEKFKDIIDPIENKISRNSNDFSEVELCSEELKSFAYHFSTKYNHVT